MNKNVLIVVIILVLVTVAGYLVWIRSRFEEGMTSVEPGTTEVVTTPSPILSPSPSATAAATPAATPKTATGAGKTK